MDQRCVTSKVVNDEESADALMELRTQCQPLKDCMPQGPASTSVVQLENVNQGSQLLRTGTDPIEQGRHGPVRILAFSSLYLKFDGTTLFHGYWQRW